MIAFGALAGNEEEGEREGGGEKRIEVTQGMEMYG